MTGHPLFNRELDSERITQEDRIGAAAAALHQARQEQYAKAQRHVYLNSWSKMWPEYQAQLRQEAQAVVWAIDAYDRAATRQASGESE